MRHKVYVRLIVTPVNRDPSVNISSTTALFPVFCYFTNPAVWRSWKTCLPTMNYLLFSICLCGFCTWSRIPCIPCLQRMALISGWQVPVWQMSLLCIQRAPPLLNCCLSQLPVPLWLLPLDELMAPCVLQGTGAVSLCFLSISSKMEASSGLLS